MQKIIHGSYETVDDFVNSMERWIDRWSDAEQASPIDAIHQIVQLGMHISQLLMLINI
jgi:hypothetical protein